MFGVLPIPGVPDWLLPEGAEETHQLTSHLWLPLLAIHVIAALWHHFVRRDDVLTRMLPERWRKPHGEKAGSSRLPEVPPVGFASLCGANSGISMYTCCNHETCWGWVTSNFLFEITKPKSQKIIIFKINLQDQIETIS